MPLVQATLAAELAALAPVETEAEVIDTFGAAWENYFSGASVLGVPVTPGSLSGATSALRSSLVGISADGAGAGIIQAAIVAFWGIVASSAASIWLTAPPPTGATTPPGLGGIQAALEAAFAANTSGGLDLVASANAVAGALHPTQLGGIALIPVPPGPQPIL